MSTRCGRRRGGSEKRAAGDASVERSERDTVEGGHSRGGARGGVGGAASGWSWSASGRGGASPAAAARLRSRSFWSGGGGNTFARVDVISTRRAPRVGGRAQGARTGAFLGRAPPVAGPPRGGRFLRRGGVAQRVGGGADGRAQRPLLA